MAKKILELIPESLHEDLINEVKEVLKTRGVEFREIDGTFQGVHKSEKELDADIQLWAKEGKEK